MEQFRFAEAELAIANTPCASREKSEPRTDLHAAVVEVVPSPAKCARGDGEAAEEEGFEEEDSDDEDDEDFDPEGLSESEGDETSDDDDYEDSGDELEKGRVWSFVALRDDDSNPVLTQINELLRKAMAASVAVRSAVWDGEVRCDPYDAVRYAVSAKLGSDMGWAAEGYESKIRVGPGGAQSV